MEKPTIFKPHATHSNEEGSIVCRCTITLSFKSGPFAASRDLCRRFNLEYGSTIAINVRITEPNDPTVTQGFTWLYATGNRIDTLRKLKAEKNGELYATLLFCEEDIRKIHAQFFGETYYPGEDPEPDDGSMYIPPEGQIIMLFTKPA